MVVYVASAWHRLAPGRASRWVLAHRRGLGRGFATAHLVHLFALSMVHIPARDVPDLPTLVGGGGAYVMLVAMVLTSNDAAVRRLGAARWKQLHTIGIHWLWVIFAYSYVGRVASGAWAFGGLVALALAGLAMRIAARFKGKFT